MKNDFLCFLSCTGNGPKPVPARDPGDYRVPILRTTHKTAPITFINRKDFPRSSTMWKNNLAPSNGAGLAGGLDRHRWMQRPEEPEQRNRTVPVPCQPGGSCRGPASVFCWRSTVLDTAEGNTDQCTDQVNSLSVIFLLDYAGDGTQCYPVGPEVLRHAKGGQSHQGNADPLEHKIKQGASQFYAPGGQGSCRRQQSTSLFLLFVLGFCLLCSGFMNGMLVCGSIFISAGIGVLLLSVFFPTSCSSPVCTGSRSAGIGVSGSS